MSKQITASELASLVNRLLTVPEGSGELGEFGAFQSFMTDIARVVCDHCGGEVRNPANPEDGVWMVGVHGNDSLPDPDGGVWRDFDPEGQLFDTQVACSRCGAATETVIGTPSGEEVCQDCFAAGAG